MHVHALALVVFAFMAKWTPLWHHRTLEPAHETLARYAEIATTIATVALDSEPLPGTTRDETALVLASIAEAESHFRRDVVTCEVGGDHDKHGVPHAWGPTQIHTAKAKVCTSFEGAFRTTLAWVRESFVACRRWPTEEKLAVYTDGACGVRLQRSRWRVGRALRWRDEFTQPW